MPNYLDRPHKYTAGPAGRCLFCSHTQTWHAMNRPRTPQEIAEEKLAQQLQDKAQDTADSALMLTPFPTEEQLVADAGKEQKLQDQAAKIAGNALYDEEDPMNAAGLGGKKPPADVDMGDMTPSGGGMAAMGSMAGVGAEAGGAVGKSQGFGGPGDADSGDAPLPGSVGANQAKVDEILAKMGKKKKAAPKPAAAASPAAAAPPAAKPAAKPAAAAGPDAESPADTAAEPGEEPGTPPDPNAPHATPLPNEGEDPGGDPGYKPPLSDQPRNGMSDAERRSHADSGAAMPDGTMPIRDDSAEPDLKAAQKVWGKHPDPHAARDHIVRRADALDLTHTLHPALQEHSAKLKEKNGGKIPAAPEPVRKYRYAVVKAADAPSSEQRYTFGPLYPASTADAHGEFADPTTLQKALWGYVRAGDRNIHLQHVRNVVAGELVEAVSWPDPHTVTLSVPGAVAKAAPVTFPAGTAYCGIVWEPWAWNLVKSGKLQGLSMGGSANRVTADLGPTNDVLKHYVAKSLIAIAKYRLGQTIDEALDEAVTKFRADQPRITRGNKGGGRWRNIAGSLSAAAKNGGLHGTWDGTNYKVTSIDVGPAATGVKQAKAPRRPLGRNPSWGGSSGLSHTVGHALDPEHSETPVPGHPGVTRITSRRVTLRQPDTSAPERRAHAASVLADAVMGSIVRGSGGARMGGASARAGMYLRKSMDLPAGIYMAPDPVEPPPFALTL